jgi:hypothetical protein
MEPRNVRVMRALLGIIGSIIAVHFYLHLTYYCLLYKAVFYITLRMLCSVLLPLV